jgi:hypothetical protein
MKMSEVLPLALVGMIFYFLMKNQNPVVQTRLVAGTTMSEVEQLRLQKEKRKLEKERFRNELITTGISQVPNLIRSIANVGSSFSAGRIRHMAAPTPFSRNQSDGGGSLQDFRTSILNRI